MVRLNNDYPAGFWDGEIQQNIASKKRSLIRRLKTWFKQNARKLPWRCTKNPYAVWVSEIMLQQTQVETVKDYYRRFMKTFPTVQKLADASEDQVLKQWEGLGYYSRARNLHKAAKYIQNHLAGRFPQDVKTWQRLPGIGQYTAGAIASIAYNQAVPVLDGNVKRVLARLFAIEESIDDAKVTTRLWQLAETLVPQNEPGDYNQALMELGSRLCRPRHPHCENCPVIRLCAAYQRGIHRQLPLRSPKKKVPHVQVVAAAIKKNGCYLLGKRPTEGMLAGLWEFPGGKVEPGETLQEALRREIEEELGIAIRVQKHLITVDHAYSHLKVTIDLFLCEHSGGKPQPLYHEQLKWVPRAQFDRYAFPAANHKFLPLL